MNSKRTANSRRRKSQRRGEATASARRHPIGRRRRLDRRARPVHWRRCPQRPGHAWMALGRQRPYRRFERSCRRCPHASAPPLPPGMELQIRSAQSPWPVLRRSADLAGALMWQPPSPAARPRTRPGRLIRDIRRKTEDDDRLREAFALPFNSLAMRRRFSR